MTLQQDTNPGGDGVESYCSLAIALSTSPASIIRHYSWIWDDPGSDLKLPWV